MRTVQRSEGEYSRDDHRQRERKPDRGREGEICFLKYSECNVQYCLKTYEMKASKAEKGV